MILKDFQKKRTGLLHQPNKRRENKQERGEKKNIC